MYLFKVINNVLIYYGFTAGQVNLTDGVIIIGWINISDILPVFTYNGYNSLFWFLHNIPLASIVQIIEKTIGTVKKLNVHSALAIAGMAGPVILVVTDLTAAFSTPDYNLVRDSISSLALTDIGWLQSIGFLTIGLLVEIFAADLLFDVLDHRGFHLSITCLALMGFGMLLLGAFHTDPVGVPETIHGTIHDVAATAVFWLFPVTCILIAPALRHDRYWESLFKYTIITGILGFALAIMVLVLSDTASWFGLAERILVANTVIWVLAMGWRLFRISIIRINY